MRPRAVGLIRITFTLRGAMAIGGCRRRAGLLPSSVLAPVRPFPECRSTLRNEANWRRKWLICHGRYGLGKRCVRERSGGLGSGGSGLEVLESFEGAEEHAVGGID